MLTYLDRLYRSRMNAINIFVKITWSTLMYNNYRSLLSKVTLSTANLSYSIQYMRVCSTTHPSSTLRPRYHPISIYITHCIHSHTQLFILNQRTVTCTYFFTPKVFLRVQDEAISICIYFLVLAVCIRLIANLYAHIFFDFSR